MSTEQKMLLAGDGRLKEPSKAPILLRAARPTESGQSLIEALVGTAFLGGLTSVIFVIAAWATSIPLFQFSLKEALMCNFMQRQKPTRSDKHKLCLRDFENQLSLFPGILIQSQSIRNTPRGQIAELVISAWGSQSSEIQAHLNFTPTNR